MSWEKTQAACAVATVVLLVGGSYMMSAIQDEKTKVLVDVLRSEMVLLRTHEARIVRLETTGAATNDRMEKVEETMDRLSYELGRLNGTLNRIEGKLEVIIP